MQLTWQSLKKLDWLAVKKQLAYPKMSWQLCLLCSLGGVAAASVIILFLFLIEWIKSQLGVIADNYSSLSFYQRFHLPFIAAGIILIVGWSTGYQYIRTGIPFVLHRLKTAYGILPIRNSINQFIGGVITLVAGFSVGREGPVVHLGAAASSAIGRIYQLPYNSIRTLCASGIAAGIAACFNTPIAAVIFVMEVILREYQVAMFIPIMLAAVIGSLLTSVVLGTGSDFTFSHQFALTLGDYPVVIISALIIGALASVFNRSLIWVIQYVSAWHVVVRFLIAAFATASLGYLVPQALGTGVSTIAHLQQVPPEFLFIFSLLLAKALMTIGAIGLGIPGGIIGPILTLGAISGGVVVLGLSWLLPYQPSYVDYMLLGMAAFMAASLNAPLAALLTVVELSGQLPIMIPAMLTITSACLISGQLFKNQSIFVLQLNLQNLSFQRPPIEASLQNIGVLAHMQENFIVSHFSEEKSHYVAELDLHDAVIREHDEQDQNLKFTLIEAKSPGIELPLLPISSQATLADAYNVMQNVRKIGVYIYDQENIDQPIGYITFSQVRQYLLKG